MSLESEYRHMVEKARDAAKGGWGAQSTGEKLASALILNRPDWLKEMGYTILEALDRIGPDWCALLRRAQKQIVEEGIEITY